MENKFEKEVHNKLSSVEITPSESVWQEVEKQLPAPVRRRPVVFWLLIPAFLILGGGGYYFFNLNQQQKQRGESVVVRDQALHPEKTAIPNGSLENEQTENKKIQSDFAQRQPEQIEGTSVHPEPKKILTILKPSAATAAEVPLIKSVAKSKSQILPDDAPMTRPIPDLGSSLTHISIFSGEIDPTGLTITHSILPVIHPTLPTIVHADNKSKKENSWKFNLSVTPGMSFLPSASARPAANAQFDFLSTSSLLPVTIPLTPVMPPSFEPGYSTTLGVEAVKNLKNGHQVFIGLEYQNIGLIEKIPPSGNYMNTLSDAGFINNNKFHYLALPAGLQINFSHNKYLPGVRLGAQLLYLISGDMMQYETGQYFKNNDLLHKVGAGVNGELVFRFIKTNYFVLNGGPYYRYSLTPLSKTGISADQHLNFVGMKLAISPDIQKRSAEKNAMK